MWLACWRCVSHHSVFLFVLICMQQSKRKQRPTGYIKKSTMYKHHHVVCLLTGWYIHATSIISNDDIRWIGAIKAFVRWIVHQNVWLPYSMRGSDRKSLYMIIFFWQEIESEEERTEKTHKINITRSRGLELVQVIWLTKSVLTFASLLRHHNLMYSILNSYHSIPVK